MPQHFDANPVAAALLQNQAQQLTSAERTRGVPVNLGQGAGAPSDVLAALQAGQLTPEMLLMLLQILMGGGLAPGGGLPGGLPGGPPGGLPGGNPIEAVLGGGLPV